MPSVRFVSKVNQEIASVLSSLESMSKSVPNFAGIAKTSLQGQRDIFVSKANHREARVLPLKPAKSIHCFRL